VATPSIKRPLLFPRGAQHALDLLFEDCAADQLCRGAFPNLKTEFTAALSRFDRGPIDATRPESPSRRAAGEYRRCIPATRRRQLMSISQDRRRR
jgi:hypothetical protein